MWLTVRFRNRRVSCIIKEIIIAAKKGEPLAQVIKLVLVFTIILLSLRRKINLGATLAGAGVLLLFLSSITPTKSLEIAISTFKDYSNLNLMANIVCITILGNVLSYTGQLNRLVKSTQAIFKDPRLATVALPALVGILPMPGGAIFSAPLVEASRTSPDTEGEVLTFINYWFRHIWEYFLPLYPGILLASSLSGLSLPWIVIHHLPFSFLAIIGGWLVIRKMKVENSSDPPVKTNFFEIIQPFIPLIPPILGIFSGIPVWAGGIMGIILTVLLGKLSFSQVIPAMFKNFPWLIMIDVAGILIFKTAITQESVLQPVIDFMISQKMPVIILGLVLAFFIALISGLTAAFVGVSFPLILPLISVSLERALPLLYIGGYLGIIFSPTHLCLILSCRYFKTDIEKVYRLLLWPSILVLSWGVIWYFI